MVMVITGFPVSQLPSYILRSSKHRTRSQLPYPYHIKSGSLLGDSSTAISQSLFFAPLLSAPQFLLTMNFAPYQDVDPERERALSPPPQDGRRSKSPQVRTPPTRSNASPPNLPHPNAFGNDYVSAGNNGGLGDRGMHFDAFQTSLPIRLDYEAMLAYILLPPAGPVLLLLTEHKSDYVRYAMTLRLDLRFCLCSYAPQISCLAIEHALYMHICTFNRRIRQLQYWLTPPRSSTSFSRGLRSSRGYCL